MNTSLHIRKTCLPRTRLNGGVKRNPSYPPTRNRIGIQPRVDVSCIV